MTSWTGPTKNPQTPKSQLRTQKRVKDSPSKLKQRSGTLWSGLTVQKGKRTERNPPGDFTIETPRFCLKFIALKKRKKNYSEEIRILGSRSRGAGSGAGGKTRHDGCRSKEFRRLRGKSRKKRGLGGGGGVGGGTECGIPPQN